MRASAGNVFTLRLCVSSWPTAVLDTTAVGTTTEAALSTFPGVNMSVCLKDVALKWSLKGVVRLTCIEYGFESEHVDGHCA